MNTRTMISLFLGAAFVVAPLAFGAGNEDARDAVAATARAGEWPGVPEVAEDLTGSARLMAIVAAITDAQISARGEASPTLPAGPTGDALGLAVEVAQRHGAALPVASVVALQTLDPALAPAVADVFRAFLVYDEVTRAAIADVDAEAVLADPDAYRGKVLLAPVMVAQENLLAAMIGLEEALAASHTRPLLPIVAPGSFSLDLRGACEDNTYTENLPLLIDDCGSDVYLNNAGGGGLGALGVLNPIVAAAMADLAGDDLYAGANPFGVNGGAFVGAGFLYDKGGNDLYDSTHANDGVNGGGSVGSGFHVDVGGDDVYRAGGWGTNGGGYITGRGLLVDLFGHDVYTGTHEAVNGGGAAGNGALWDDEGDDSYTAWSFGVNGGGQTGTGLLYDRFGVDVYEDEAGGSGIDVTVLPKELSGAQVDDA